MLSLQNIMDSYSKSYGFLNPELLDESDLSLAGLNVPQPETKPRETTHFAAATDLKFLS